MNHGRHRDFGDRHHAEKAPQQNTKRIFRERAGGGAVAFKAGREQRHERGVESAFGEQAAKQVGQLERDDPGVHPEARAEKRGDQHIANETKDPADHRERADGGDGTDQNHGTGPARAAAARGRDDRGSESSRLLGGNAFGAGLGRTGTGDRL